MPHKDLPPELVEYINLGEERLDVEYKADSPWSDEVHRLDIAKAMMALSNTKGGGVLVVGVKDDGSRDGISTANVKTYKRDDIARYLNNRTMPPINFEFTKGKTQIVTDEKLFVVFQVAETKKLPLVCTENEKKQGGTKTVEIRKNAIYIRSKSPVESREIGSYQEWQDFIDLLLDKNQKELLSRLPCAHSTIPKPVKRTDEDKFKKQLKQIKE